MAFSTNYAGPRLGRRRAAMPRDLALKWDTNAAFTSVTVCAAVYRDNVFSKPGQITCLLTATGKMRWNVNRGCEHNTSPRPRHLSWRASHRRCGGDS